MKNLIIFISLIVGIKCQVDPGFRLNGLQILGGQNRLNSNGLSNLKNLNNLNSGLNANENAGMMGIILGVNNLTSLPNINENNQFPQLPQMPQLPFTDGQSYKSQPTPIPLPLVTGDDYKKEILSSGPILAPGRLAPLPQVPEIPTILPLENYNNRFQLPPKELGLSAARSSFTASLKDTRTLSTLDFKQPLFDAALTPKNNMNNMNNVNSMNNLQFNNNGLSYKQFASDSSNLAFDKIPIEVSQFSTQITHDIPKLPLAQPQTLLFPKGNGLK